MTFAEFSEIALEHICRQDFRCAELALTGSPRRGNDPCIKCKMAYERGYADWYRLGTEQPTPSELKPGDVVVGTSVEGHRTEFELKRRLSPKPKRKRGRSKKMKQEHRAEGC